MGSTSVESEPLPIDSLMARLRGALALESPYEGAPRGMEAGTPASVLIALGYFSSSSEPHLLVTRRTHKVETHKGQMAFPGGHTDPEDDDAVATALREAREEVGLDSRDLTVLGTLPALDTVTRFRVTPVVSVVRTRLEDLSLTPAEDEIDAMVWVSLRQLREVYRREAIEHGQIRYPIDVFQVDEYRIWGVTGTLIKNLLDRMERVG